MGTMKSFCGKLSFIGLALETFNAKAFQTKNVQSSTLRTLFMVNNSKSTADIRFCCSVLFLYLIRSSVVD